MNSIVKTKRSFRESVCWECSTSVDNSSDYECKACGWIIVQIVEHVDKMGVKKKLCLIKLQKVQLMEQSLQKILHLSEKIYKKRHSKELRN